MARYSGVFPVAPTAFTDNGDIDFPSQLRVIDFLIDAGVDGICILANYSEQFTLTDEERDELTERILDHVGGRVPIIVTTSHYSTRIAKARSERAQQLGANMVMLLPPYHGATIHADEAAIILHFQRIAEHLTIPIMLQDAPVSGIPLSATFLWQLAQAVPVVRYFKIESPRAADKLHALLALSQGNIEGPFDGEESVTLLPDLDAGATGTMPSSLIPDTLGRIVRLHRSRHWEEARELYERYLPLIHYENRQCGLRAAKAVLHAGGILASDHVRLPQEPLPASVRQTLLDLARRRDILALRWAR